MTHLLALLWLALLSAFPAPPRVGGGAGGVADASPYAGAAHGATCAGAADPARARAGTTADRSTARAPAHALHAPLVRAPSSVARSGPRDPARASVRESAASPATGAAPRRTSAPPRQRATARLFAVAAHGARPPYLPTAPPLHG